MPRAASSRLGWLLWTVDMAIVAVAVAVLVVVRFAPAADAFAFPGFAAMLGTVYAAVGVLLAVKRPENPTGWVFLVSGLLAATQELATVYVVLAHQRPALDLPGVAHAAWLVDWIWIPYFLGTMIFLLLAFPGGRLVGRRARVIAALALVGMLLAFVGASLGNIHLEVFPDLHNPFVLLGDENVANALAGGGFAVIGLAAVLAVIDLARRWHVAGGVERQQYRWLLAAGMLTGFAFGIGAVSYALTGAFDTIGSRLGGRLLEGLLAVGLTAVPIAVGIAITRYGLYELDRLISRSLSYSLVIAALAGVYSASVIALRSMFPPQGDLAVAVSTLAVALLINPLRHRVQARVDRRFNRARFDAQRELERFAVRLRDHLDVDELTDDLTAFAATTMQPSTVGVWNRSSAPRESDA